MTPLEIETLIKIYCQPCEKLNKLGLDVLRAEGLVQLNPSCPPPDCRVYHGYVVTNKGKAMIDALTNLPIPERKVYWRTEFEQITDEKNL